MVRLSDFPAASNSIDVLRLIILDLHRTLGGPLPPEARRVLRALDEAAGANAAEWRS
jgi:hypothetical protein